MPIRPHAKKSAAKRLRRDMTDAEHRLWYHLRRDQTGFHFRRQHPIGPYIADFVCLPARLVIEADGGQHADSSQDARRDAYLQTQGFRTLRFWNSDVLAQTDAVPAVIMATLTNHHAAHIAPTPRAIQRDPNAR